MAAPGGAPGPTTTPTQHRENRWLGQGYADITKLREIAAKHDRLSTRCQQKAARVQTRIERLRHGATVLREKAQKTLDKVPEVQQEIAQYERNIQAGTQKAGLLAAGSDITEQQVRMRKLQQKVINLQHKARTLEHRAAQRAQKSAELKVKVDQLLERSRLEEQEAVSFRQRADRLQMATEGEVAAHLTATSDGGSPPPPGPA
jgi:peptidoglycan hydrolase CwlO-like protein